MAHHRSTGWGLGGPFTGPHSWLIFNFDVDSASLKIEHRAMLKSWVVPELQMRHGISIIGLTSRTGRSAHNLRLSKRRADQTLDFLRSEVRNNFRALNVIGLGELAAAKQDPGHHREDPRFRSVVLLAAPSPVPPSPPPVVDLTKILSPRTIPGRDLADDAQWGIDRTTDILSVLAELPWEHIAEFADRTSFGLSIIGAAVQMPLLWASLRHQNHTNGKLQGFWDAMQDMANAYGDPDLQTTPVAKWPPLRKPHPHAFSAPDRSVNQSEWMEGKEEGCEAAYDLIRDMETTPREIQGRLCSGRQLLAQLARDFGERLKEEIQRAYEKKMGKSWPIMG